MRIMMLLLCCCIGQLAHAQTVVVVAKNSTIESLDDQHVANIFLARTNRFPNGEKANPIELQNNQKKMYFYQEISGKTPSQLNAYWTTIVFTGKGKPPKNYPAHDDIKISLKNQPGAITYLPLDQVTEDMKVVYTFP